MTKSLKASLRKTLAGVVMMTTIFSLSGVAALVPTAQAATFVTGDLIRNPNQSGMEQFDVYVVKVVGTKMFKRLVLNPAIFNSYGGLFKWSNVKSVTAEEMNLFKTSGMIRVETAPQVYAVAPVAGSDVGSKSWLNVPASDFIAAGGDWDAVYTVNTIDGAGYSAATDLTTQAQVVTYLTTGALPGVTPTPVSGAVTVSMASDSPAAGTLASSSAYNTMLKLNIANGSSSEVSVTGLTVTRTGFSVDTNVAGVLIKDAAGARHGNVLTLSEAKAALAFASDPIKVAANSTSVVSILANLSSTATSGTIGFKVAVATDVTTNATAVNGTFPIMGSTFTLVDGSNTLGGISIQSQTISTSARATDIGVIGQEVGKFKFTETSSKEAVVLNKIRFYNNGNSTDADLANIELYNTNTGSSLAKVASATSKYVVFDLSASPLKFDKGTNKTLSVRADVVNGSTRTAQFIVQNDYDIEASGVDTGSGVLATVVANADDGNVTTFPVGSTTNFNTISITAGSLTVSKDASSPSGNIGQGQSGIVLGAWKLEARGEDIQIQKAGIDLGTGSTVEGDFTGTVKLVIGDATIYSVAASTDALWDGTNPQNSLATYYTIKAGTTAIVKIVADSSSSATNAATIQAEFGNVYYYKASSNAYATANATLIAANSLTINTTGLTVAKNTAMGNSTVVAGQSGVKLGSYVLQAGSAEGVNVSTVNITMDDVTSLSNLKLYKGATQIGSTVASPAASANAFSVGGSLTIAASASAVIDVYGDIATGSTTTYTSSIAASGISANGTPSGTTVSSVPAAAVTGQAITATASGTLTLSTDTATPVQAILHADQAGVEVARFKLAGTVEPIKVTKIVLESANGSGNMQGLALWDSVTQVGTTSDLVNGKVTFSGLSLIISKDSSKTFKVTMGTTPTGTLVSAQQIGLAVGSVEALGNSSGVTVYPSVVTTAASAGTLLAAGTAAATVTSTVGFNVGDAVLAFNATDGVEWGMVITVDSATAMKIGTEANTTTAAARVTKLPSIVTTAASAGTLLAAGTAAATVTSTNGFAVGDAVLAFNATDGVELGVVVTIDSTTAMKIATKADTTAAVTRVTRLASSATTAASAGTLLAAGTAAATVTSTTGFAVGDTVFAFNATDGVELGMVVSIDSATAMKIGTEADTTTAAARVTKISSFATTAASAGIPLVAGVATTVTSNAGAAIGSPVVVFNATDGVEIGMVSAAVSGTTSLTIAPKANMTVAATRVTILWSSTGASNPFYVEDVEPVITLASGSPSGLSSGSSAQVVAKFSFKADGTRDLTIKSLTLTRGGNIGANVATTAQPKIYISGTSNLLGTGADWSGTTNGSTSAITLTSPYTITAGDTVTFDVVVDTSSAAVNNTFQVYLDGKAGTFGNLSWYYDAAAPSPGTEPTNASPATISDSYPVYGGSLTY